MPLTQKQQRIIRNNLKRTEEWWRQLKKRVEFDILNASDYEDFLERTKDYTTNNIIEDLASETAQQVVQSVNYAKLERRDLTRETINNNVADLVIAVGDDLKYEIREMVKKGYDLGYHPSKIAPLVISRNLEALYIIPEYKTFTQSQWDKLPLSEQLKYTQSSGFRQVSPEQRSKMIARTEVKRAQTIVNYLTAKQDGAIGFTVKCRPDCCKYCAEAYADITGKDYDDLIESDRKQLIGGNVEFTIEDTDFLPPFHPQCNCSAQFFYKK